jgi:hypothetical protein
MPLSDSTEKYTKSLDAALQLMQQARRSALLKEANGRRIYAFDVVLGIAALLGFAAMCVDFPHFEPFSVLGYVLVMMVWWGARVHRRMNALRDLVVQLHDRASAQ